MRYRTECSLQVIFHKIWLVYPTGVYFGQSGISLVAVCITSFRVILRHSYLWPFMVIYGYLYLLISIYASHLIMHVSICYFVAYISVCVLEHTFILADSGDDSEFWKFGSLWERPPCRSAGRPFKSRQGGGVLGHYRTFSL